MLEATVLGVHIKVVKVKGRKVGHELQQTLGCKSVEQQKHSFGAQGPRMPMKDV